MLCGAITWSRYPSVIQRSKLLEVSLTGRENVAETNREFEKSASPVAWHVRSWCNVLQLTWCPDCNKYYTKCYCTNCYTIICPSHEHSCEWGDRHTEVTYKSCATTPTHFLNFRLWNFFISLFWHVGFWNDLKVFGKSVDPSHRVYMYFIHSEEPVRTTCIFLWCVLFAVLKIFKTFNIL